MTFLATLYFNFILPYYYYEINLFDKPSNNFVNKKFINNITTSDTINDFINIDKINYTNKNIYIRF